MSLITLISIIEFDCISNRFIILWMLLDFQGTNQIDEITGLFMTPAIFDVMKGLHT